ncbi:MAG: bifunctional 3-deoxy-7-phosphoheptulonate synthase/chorismate mutase type II [Bacteroidota bacterium]|nr:bifunctional 3-deoxy-7-phosphoheptulonate synthase/chorismate mutase type II [Bacteroidota bacterium]
MTKDIRSNSGWLKNENKRALIAGPCSAESEMQVLDTATQIAAFFPDAIFRAGAWKPRTRPNQFEGRGEPALEWLSKVKSVTGLRVTTEVAIPRHVEQALKHGIDILWIGARTTVNPFLVQELAESLRGISIPVMIKNPLHPDLQLWIGAIERFSNVGLTQLAAIHRGFYTFEHSEYRNAPRWELVYELKSLFPELPVVCDISHIAGSTSLLQMVAQQAVDLSVDGLMIETHCNPSSALSDAQQQVTPDRLHEIIGALKFRNPGFTREVVRDRMADIRKKIDELDNLLLNNLSQRMELAKEIGELKKVHNVSILQLERWKEVIEQCMHKADEMGMYREFVRNIFIQIHDEAIRLQSAIMTETESAEKIKL